MDLVEKHLDITKKNAELLKDNQELVNAVNLLRQALSECMQEIELLREINGILADNMNRIASSSVTQMGSIITAKLAMSQCKRLIEKAGEEESVILWGKDESDGQQTETAKIEAEETT